MKERIIKYLMVLAVGVLFGFFGGTAVQLNQDSEVLEERVYAYFGEGDYGLQLNDYLQTGDLSIYEKVIISQTEEDGYYNVQIKQGDQLWALDCLTPQEYYEEFGYYPYGLNDEI